MLADYLLRVLGHPPGEIDDPRDKWPTIAANLIDLLVPFLLVFLFFLPLIIIRWRWKKFTMVNVVVSVVIGGLLAWGGWWLNQWSYGYGVGVIWHAINTP